LVPDRLGRLLSPMVALTAAAAVTSRLRLGTFVLAAGLRRPAVVAHESTTLDLLSGGRVEIGFGAGVSEEDATRAGVPFGSPGERVQQLAETVREVKASFSKVGETTALGGLLAAVQRPHPPILVAGGGRQMLSVAAREADIVSIGPAHSLDEESLSTRVGWVREAAGARLGEMELNMNLAAVAVNGALPASMEHRLRSFFGTSLEALVESGSPFVLSGSVEQMAAQLLERRARYGISYVCVSDEVLEEFSPVVRALTGV